MLKEKLQEELNRFNAINKYSKKMIVEQDAPPAIADPAASPADVGATPPPAGTEAPVADAGTPPPTDAAPDAAAGGPTPPAEDDTQDIDVTELVDLTKSIKNDLDNHKNNQDAAVTKMDDIFTKLNDLEQKLSAMDNIVAKIDQLGQEVQQMKPESPQEKLEMRSLDSYPFNQKPQEFFNEKQNQMRQSGKNEYILTKNDVTNYPQDIKTTFNPNDKEEVDEYKF